MREFCAPVDRLCTHMRATSWRAPGNWGRVEDGAAIIRADHRTVLFMHDHRSADRYLSKAKRQHGRLENSNPTRPHPHVGETIPFTFGRLAGTVFGSISVFFARLAPAR